MAHNILGLPKEIEVAIEIENQEARVEVIDHIMLRRPPEEFQREIVLEADLFVAVITQATKCRPDQNTTGASTRRFALPRHPRGLEVTVVQHP